MNKEERIKKYNELVKYPTILNKDKKDYTKQDVIYLGEQLKDMLGREGFAILYDYLTKQMDALLGRIVGEISGESLEDIKLQRETHVQTYRAIKHEIDWIFGNIAESDKLKSELRKGDGGGE